MPQRPKTVALVPAAGRGLRLGSSTPKAFVQLREKSLLQHAVAALSCSGAVDHIVVIASEGMAELARRQVPDAQVVLGGAERTDSVRAGLAVCPSADAVLVHDAARPLTPTDMIVRVVDALADHDAVVPVLPVVDTIKSVTDDGIVSHTVDRAHLRRTQTPQGFSHELLMRAYHHCHNHLTDDAGLVELLGADIRTVTGDEMAFKITTPWDLRIAEMLSEHGRNL